MDLVIKSHQKRRQFSVQGLENWPVLFDFRAAFKLIVWSVESMSMIMGTKEKKDLLNQSHESWVCLPHFWISASWFADFPIDNPKNPADF